MLAPILLRSRSASLRVLGRERRDVRDDARTRLREVAREEQLHAGEDVPPQIAVDVLRGPSSTYYGSGALGGVVQVFPREFESLRLTLGYDSYGDENYQVLGWGAGDW